MKVQLHNLIYRLKITRETFNCSVFPSIEIKRIGSKTDKAALKERLMKNTFKEKPRLKSKTGWYEKSHFSVHFEMGKRTIMVHPLIRNIQKSFLRWLVDTIESRTTFSLSTSALECLQRNHLGNVWDDNKSFAHNFAPNKVEYKSFVIGPRCPWGPIYGSGCLSLTCLTPFAN